MSVFCDFSHFEMTAYYALKIISRSPMSPRSMLETKRFLLRGGNFPRKRLNLYFSKIASKDTSQPSTTQDYTEKPQQVNLNRTSEAKPPITEMRHPLRFNLRMIPNIFRFVPRMLHANVLYLKTNAPGVAYPGRSVDNSVTDLSSGL